MKNQERDFVAEQDAEDAEFCKRLPQSWFDADLFESPEMKSYLKEIEAREAAEALDAPKTNKDSA